MAYKDPRSPLFAASLDTESDQDPIAAKADRLFADLALEMGLTEPDLMMQGPSEEATLIYDKFSVRRR